MLKENIDDIYLEFNDCDKNKYWDHSVLSKNRFISTNVNLDKINLCNQGIYWNTIHRQRNNLRTLRNESKTYRQFQTTNLEKKLKEEYFQKQENDIFYQFSEFWSATKISVQHFQLRKGLKFVIFASSDEVTNELAYFEESAIICINVVTKQKLILVRFQPEEINFNEKPISFDVIKFPNTNEYLLACGKVNNTIIIYRVSFSNLNGIIIKNSSVLLNKVIKQLLPRPLSVDDNILINNVRFLDNSAEFLVVCSNDSTTRVYDITKDFEISLEFKSQDCVNHCDFDKNKRLLCCGGDFKEIDVFDFRSQKKEMSLSGHYDFSFSTRFNPLSSGNILGSANQDHTLKLWDLRKGDNCNYKTLYGVYNPIGDLIFIGANNTIVYFENNDYLYIYNEKSDTYQQLQLFGSISGVAYNQNTKNIFVGNYEEISNGIIIYEELNYNINNIKQIIF